MSETFISRFICHPIKDKCLTYNYIEAMKKETVGSIPYTGNENQRWKWDNDYNITQ